MSNNLYSVSNIYNHYLTTYAPKSTTPFDTHKKSELRGIYNAILKMSKDSPLFLFNNTQKTMEFAVGIKESARQMRNTIASLGGLEENNILRQKIAYSSRENIASAEFIGDSAMLEDCSPVTVEVKSLASNQQNLGLFLPANEKALPCGMYSFDISVNQMNYEFQYQINEDDTNKSIQKRLARLVNNSYIGLNAEVRENEEGGSALMISSQQTGAPPNGSYLFAISDDKTSKTTGSVSYFGINKITHSASNAEFVLDGTPMISASNHFQYEKRFAISLHGISPQEGETTTIGIKNDTESLLENINTLSAAYNNFLYSATKYPAENTNSTKLMQEIKSISSNFGSRLESIGLSVDQDGSLHPDLELMAKAVDTEELPDTAPLIKEFTMAVLQKTAQISLNPMEYVDKKIVAYKIPGRNFTNPYITCAYSGMLFSGYC